MTLNYNTNIGKGQIIGEITLHFCKGQWL